MDLHSYPNPKGIAIGVLSILSVTLIGLAVWQSNYGDKLGQDILKQDGVIAHLNSELFYSKDMILKLQAQVADLNTKTTIKHKAYAGKTIPPLPSIPATNEELAANLQNLGLTVLPTIYDQAETFDAKVELAKQSILFRTDAETVFTWANKATVTLPATEDKLKACDELQTAQAAEIEAVRKLLNTQTTAIQTSDSIIAKQTEQNDTLKKALKNEERKRWQKWLYAGAGALLVYAVKK